MNTKDVNILIWDDPSNFNLPETQRVLANNLYKSVHQFNSYGEFERILKRFDDDDFLVICCHVKYTDFSGYFDFKNSSIKEDFYLNEIIYLSSGDSGEAMKSLSKKYNEKEKIIMYNELLRNIKTDDIKPFTKNTLLKGNNSNNNINTNENVLKIDYAVITALEEDEMENFLNIVERERTFENDKHLVEYGHLKSKKI